MSGGSTSSTDEVPRRPRRRPPSARQLEETAANQRAILQRAVEFFAHHGYEKTTLQAVAESVDLSRTGLLHHFSSKEALFLRAIEECRQWADVQIGDRDRLGGLAGIRALSGFLGKPEDAVWVRFAQMLRAEALHADAPAPLMAFVEQRSANIQRHLEGRLREAIQDGDVKDLDVTALATALASAINGIQVQWLLDPGFAAAAAFDALTEALQVGAPGEVVAPSR